MVAIPFPLNPFKSISLSANSGINSTKNQFNKKSAYSAHFQIYSFFPNFTPKSFRMHGMPSFSAFFRFFTILSFLFLQIANANAAGHHSSQQIVDPLMSPINIYKKIRGISAVEEAKDEIGLKFFSRRTFSEPMEGGGRVLSRIELGRKMKEIGEKERQKLEKIKEIERRKEIERKKLAKIKENEERKRKTEEFERRMFEEFKEVERENLEKVEKIKRKKEVRERWRKAVRQILNPDTKFEKIIKKTRKMKLEARKYCLPGKLAKLFGEEYKRPKRGNEEMEGEEGARRSWEMKRAIRLGLRKFFCDEFLWQREKTEENWTFLEIGMENGGEKGNLGKVGQYQHIFRKKEKNPKSANQPSTGHSNLHNFDLDFKMTIYYPNEFEGLWGTFGTDSLGLAASLTKGELKGFVNPAKSDSVFLLSSDKKFFLKSVQETQLAPFGLKMEKLVENHFFFTKEQQEEMRRGNLVRKKDKKMDEEGGNGGSGEGEKGFEGGIGAYFEYIRRKGNATFLPKFHLLFRFEWLPKEGKKCNECSNYLFFVQNSVFPEEIPQIEFKFDLKGSAKNRKIDVEEAVGECEKMGKNVREIVWKDLNFARFYQEEKAEKRPIGFFQEGIILEETFLQKFKKTLAEDVQFLADRDILDYSLLLGIHFLENEEKNIAGHSQGQIAKCRSCGKWKFDGKGKTKIGGKQNEGNGEWRQIRIHFGVIDMLQSYVWKKQFEAFMKRLFFNKTDSFAFPDTSKHPIITIIPANDYKKRFLDYITTVVFRKDGQMDEKREGQGEEGEMTEEQSKEIREMEEGWIEKRNNGFEQIWLDYVDDNMKAEQISKTKQKLEPILEEDEEWEEAEMNELRMRNGHLEKGNVDEGGE